MQYSLLKINTDSRPRINNSYINIFTAKGGPKLLYVAIAVLYLVMPIILYFYIEPNMLYLELAGMAITAIAGIIIGYKFTVFDSLIKNKSKRIIINSNVYVSIIGGLFFVYCLVTVLTAPSIPIISAIMGGNSDLLSQERGEFLKGRKGPWIVLLYMSSIFTSTLMPYCLIHAYMVKNKFRHLLTIIFLAFSISFLVKALFLNFIIPFAAYYIETKKIKKKQFLMAVALVIAFLTIMISLSKSAGTQQEKNFEVSQFFSVTYATSSSLQFLLYRSISIPVITAVDTIYVHSTRFAGEMMLGSTSSLLAAITGQEKINLERIVFEHQYGGWNDFANSNVTFIIDAFVNFGWIGVLIFGMIVGLTFRIFKRSEDVAFRSIAPLYTYLLISSPLIGMFLSNGYLILFLQSFLIKLKLRHEK